MGKVTINCLGNLGRLGNQLFQMATTIGYALDHKKHYVFPRWKYQEYIPMALQAVHTDVEVSEEGIRYSRLPYAEGNVNLHGHFLSENYFVRHRDYILEYFKLTPEWEEYIKNKYSHIIESPSTCSIHIRRGDYLNRDQLAFHGLIPVKWYMDAIYKLYQNPITPGIKFVVFSDDIEWCKSKFPADWIYIEGENEIIDLFLMSKCKDNIIANSSFSWWGAWLNQNTNKRVVAPKKWFIDTDGWPELYAENWSVI